MRKTTLPRRAARLARHELDYGAAPARRTRDLERLARGSLLPTASAHATPATNGAIVHVGAMGATMPVKARARRETSPHISATNPRHRSFAIGHPAPARQDDKIWDSCAPRPSPQKATSACCADP